MDFDKVIEKRKSVRSFKDTKSPFKEAILAADAAIQGPFAGNNNHTKFIFIEDKTKINKIAEYCQQTWIAEAPLLIVVGTDDLSLEKLYGSRGKIYSRQQAGAAIATFLLKIVDSGLSACWVGAFSDELIKHTINMPQNIQIDAIIPVGWEKKSSDQKGKPRKIPLDTAVYFENWGARKRPTMFPEAPRHKDPWR